MAVELSANEAIVQPAEPIQPSAKPVGAPSRGFRRWAFRLLLLAAILGGLGVATGVIPVRRTGDVGVGADAAAKERTKQRESKPVVVTVDPATARPIQRKVQIVGTLIGREELTVTSKAEGRIVRLNYDLGDEVKPGDVLLQVDDTDYRLAVAEAERGLELELSKLGLRALPSEDLDLNQLPTVLRAAALESNARSRSDRARRLLNSRSMSEEEFTLADADHKVAKANHRQALLEARSTLAAIRQKQAALDIARQKLADTKVLVPAISTQAIEVIGPGGSRIEIPPVTRLSVSRRMASEGEILRVSPTTSMSVFKLVVDDFLKLGAIVPERHLNEVKIGQEVDIEVEANPGQTFKGLVLRMNPTVDPANRTFQIVVGVRNLERKLRAGSFAKASVFTRIDSNAITVPEEALVSFAGVTKVFVADGERAREVHVTPGIRVEVGPTGRAVGWIEVAGDLKPGELIVTSGQTQLSEGKPVRIRDVK